MCFDRFFNKPKNPEKKERSNPFTKLKNIFTTFKDKRVCDRLVIKAREEWLRENMLNPPPSEKDFPQCRS